MKEYKLLGADLAVRTLDIKGENARRQELHIWNLRAAALDKKAARLPLTERCSERMCVWSAVFTWNKA